MSKIDLNLINKYFVNKMESKKNYLIDEGKEIEKNILVQKSIFNDNKKYLHELRNHNDELQKKYNMLKDILRKKGIIFTIKNTGIEINEWDNLFLDKEYNSYIIKTKKGQTVIELEGKINEFIESMIENGNNYRILVIRIHDNNITIQIRIGDI